LQANKILSKELTTEEHNISILSNITVNQIKELLEYSLRTENVNANVKIANYDNIVQDSLKYSNSNLVIIFWELCNLIDGFQYRVELMKEKDLNELLEKTKSEIDLVFKNLKNTSLVLFNKFSSLSFASSNIRPNKFEKLAKDLNNYLEKVKPSNTQLVDIDKNIAIIGVQNSIDFRYYYSSKALYNIEFLKNYVLGIKPYIMSATGKSKKALIFDCDNTLWKGILGEDGYDNIEMSSKTKNGAIFAEVQNIALALNKHGVLIGLCSKNNPQDIDNVIKTHPDMQLKEENITINKSNWSDKVTNLKSIAKGLNIGLDSLVFIDDSSFEVNLIRDQLPQVTVLQVPEKLYEYPKLLRDNLGLFYNLSSTSEDSKKVEMYKQQVERDSAKSEFETLDDYLASLELTMTIFEDEESIIPRMAQMTQKTNQFNLTTKRYTEADINKYIDSNSSKVYAISISDKFGDSGVTGLCIVKMDSESSSAEIDTFLMSCRIIGRNIEYAFMDYLIENLKENGIEKVQATYIKTLKNEQVKEFYSSCSFSEINSTNDIKEYELIITRYKAKNFNYIKRK